MVNLMPEARILMPELMWQKLVRIAGGQFPEIVIFTQVMPRTSGNVPEKDVIYGWVEAIDFLRYESGIGGCCVNECGDLQEDVLLAWTYDWVLMSERTWEGEDPSWQKVMRIPRHPNVYEHTERKNYDG